MSDRKFRSIIALKTLQENTSRRRQPDILRVVRDAPNGMTVQDISKQLRLSPGMVDYTVKVLEDENQVKLRYDAGNLLVSIG